MIILIDSNLYKKEDFGPSFDFMLSHGLIELKEYLLSYKVSFVGEVLTPSNHFISLPKNFTKATELNAELVKNVLKEFKGLKKKGKLLIKNKSYEIGNEIESDFFYWRKLYSYFIDYITYEFYFPKKRKILHSLKSQNGRLNPMLTELNRNKYGNGITFEVKDYKDDFFRNVFYTTLKSLEEEFASETESNKIRELEIFLKNKKIEFRVDKFPKAEVISALTVLETNPIHETIKKTIFNYYLNSKIKEKNTINVFYTREFEYLFEYLLQKVLNHNKAFKNNGWLNPEFKTLHPDIIAESFIGDAKYYRISDFSNNPFEKELYAYNIANNNSQPNFVFILSEETKHLQTLVHKEHRLEVLTVNLETILSDFHKKRTETLNYVQTLI